MTAETGPKVSVCMITYNHARYVRRAVEGVLAQEAPFGIELVVGDDASEDDTPFILRQLALENPGRIRLFLGAENRGMMANFMSTLAACHSPFVALCEGDDYWIDPGKIRRQITELETHPLASVSFHNAWIERVDGSRSLFHPRSPGREFTGSDLLKSWLVPTASAVFRNPGLERMPEYFATATHGDLALFLWLAERGTFLYSDQVMSVYLRHDGGVTAGFQGVGFNRQQIAFLHRVDQHFGGKYRRLIRRRVAGLHRSNALHLVLDGNREGAWNELLAGWASSGPKALRGVRETLQIIAGAVAPGCYRRVRTWWRRNQ